MPPLLVPSALLLVVRLNPPLPEAVTGALKMMLWKALSVRLLLELQVIALLT
jgi:hypothetical protein